MHLFINPHPAKHSIARETQKQIKQLCGIKGRYSAIPLTCSQNVILKPSLLNQQQNWKLSCSNIQRHTSAAVE